jgi:hypothetical protein
MIFLENCRAADPVGGHYFVEVVSNAEGEA